MRKYATTDMDLLDLIKENVSYSVQLRADVEDLQDEIEDLQYKVSRTEAEYKDVINSIAVSLEEISDTNVLSIATNFVNANIPGGLN